MNYFLNNFTIKQLVFTTTYKMFMSARHLFQQNFYLEHVDLDLFIQVNQNFKKMEDFFQLVTINFVDNVHLIVYNFTSTR